MKHSWVPKLLLAAASLFFTSYFFLNTYEVVFNKDIAIANSIHPAAAQGPIDNMIEQFDIKPEADPDTTNSVYEKLSRIVIPAINSTLYLEEKRNINHQWYIRPSMGHVVGLNKDNNGVTLDYLIYTERSWRTFPSPNQIEQGMDVKLFHDGNLSWFKVAEKKVLPLNEVFVPSKTKQRQIIILVEDPANNVYYAFSLEMKG